MILKPTPEMPDQAQ